MKKFVQVSESGQRRFVAIDSIAAIAAAAGGINTRLVLNDGTMIVISVDFKEFVRTLKEEGDCEFFSGGGSLA